MKRRVDLHPTLRRRVGSVAEAALLFGAVGAVWISIGWVVIGALAER